MIAKHKLCACGCGRSGPLYAKKMLKLCYFRMFPPKPIKKVSAKKAKQIVASNKYYRIKIEGNILRNKGVCRCENCNDEIKNPVGRNVSHIISSGANATLYLDLTNSYVLCDKCEAEWTSGSRTSMKIWPDAKETIDRLNHKYYNE